MKKDKSDKEIEKEAQEKQKVIYHEQRIKVISKLDKKIILISVAVLLVLIIGSIFTIRTVKLNNYNKGYNQAVIDIVSDQTNTGNIYLIDTNSNLQRVPITNICGGNESG